MKPFRTKIRAVRFKRGGEIRVLPPVREMKHIEAVVQMRRFTEQLVALYPGRLAGFVLIGWATNGESSVGLVNKSTSPMNTSQIPAFIKERVSRSFGEDDAQEIVRGMLGYPDDSA